MNGILPLYKPRGMTSFDCVRKLRKILNTKKIGHSGTLDPNVDGVLPICIGNATKVVDFLMGHSKIYQGSITLGLMTTTEDLDGEVIKRKAMMVPLSNQQINSGLHKMVSDDLIQIPPMYSAVKVNGRKLYEYARAHQNVKRPKRHIQVKSFEQIKPFQYNALKHQQTIYFRVKCSKGTYVRTLAVDFGKQFHIPAVMSDLKRLSSGGFDLSQTYSFEEIQSAVLNHRIEKLLKPIDTILQQYVHDSIDDYQWKRVINGAFLYPDELKAQGSKIVITYRGIVRAIYYYDDKIKKYKPYKMINIR
ncbi:tRNA pseudouridine synthase B [Philodulcilactobacillus myokoensis]|uniref:tRNA pseudouridine synthase B n=1 Tax=Philodulcilactobacillus myokoensis TaxID=2929573 RepID=A0A9W6ESM6_9LACO|nr:tRNA pseudouridine(55) synthase TruB [Philodulcilactobacillus myokoensis]GLB46940.1 tRNA pseudouridine synthase B [Philodulcilactobacillus myokoensis]